MPLHENKTQGGNAKRSMNHEGQENFNRGEIKAQKTRERKDTT